MSAARAVAGALIRRLPRRPRPVILMYHRIAERAFDPWGLCVRPERFHDQLGALQDARTPLPLTEFAERCAASTIPNDAVAVTFDDGYADNARVARPMLEAAGIPATMFVTSDVVATGQPFWWDDLERIAFTPAALRATLELEGRTITVDEPAMTPRDTPRSGWRAFGRTRSARARLYLKLWQVLQAAAPTARNTALAELARSTQPPAADPENLPMSGAELAALASPLIEVAAHGRTHQRLTTCSADEQRDEIEGSRAAIAKLTGVSSTSFAYPHGDQDDNVRNAARQAGVERACTTRATAIDVSAFDPLAMPRIAVGDWSGPELLRRMRRLGS